MQYTQIKKIHPLEWLFEKLESHPSFLRKRMFGSLAAYLHGKLVLVLSAQGEPWNGILIPTEKEYHPDLKSRWKELKSHPILKKWLYISQRDPNFEEISLAIVDSIQGGDPKIGVEPKPKPRAISKPRVKRMKSTLHNSKA